MIWKFLLAGFFLSATPSIFAQTDSAAIEKLRTESGVDPTRVQSRISYSLQFFDQKAEAGMVVNKAKITLGVNRWSFACNYELAAISPGIAGKGFTSGGGDIKFSLLNAFYVKGKDAFAASVEFNIPTGKPGFGTQYFLASPGFTYARTLNQSLFLAFQPQYSFHLLKDPIYPNLSVLTIRAFLAKFTKTGFFLVFEPRPVFDFANKQSDLIFSPIIGKSLGGGFNLIFLMEYSTSKYFRDIRGTLFQVGINKSF